MQTDVSVDNTTGKITGTLHYCDSGSLATTWGAGYFLALKWTNPDTHATSMKAGMIPSMGSGLVECISDTDRNGVFKITDKALQTWNIIQSGTGYGATRQEYDLSGLTLSTS